MDSGEVTRGERRKGLEAAMGQGHPVSWEHAQDSYMGRRALSDWWPGGPRGAQGATRAGHFPQDTWRGQALGCWVYHFGHLDYEETPPPPSWRGYNTKGLSLLFCPLGCRDRVSLGSHRLVEGSVGFESPSRTLCAHNPGKVLCTSLRSFRREDRGSLGGLWG